jgi:hypothetical protein
MKKLPKLVEIEWENGDVHKAYPIAENNDRYFFDVKESGCYWAWKVMCKIIEEQNV